MRGMIRALLLSLLGLVLAVLIGGLIYLDRQFEEPGAAFTPSLAGELEARSVLAVFAHPDDEQLITGLLIRAVERDGATTRMITATRGENGTPLPQISRIEDLGVIRHAEVLKSGWALGVEEQLVWDYPDGRLREADFELYVERLVAQMREWRPDLIVTFWPESGFSNHPDHMMAGRAATEAVRRLQESEPDLAPTEIAYILAPRRMMRNFGGERGRVIAENQPDPTHEMPGEGWAKIRGWRIHASQADFVQHEFGLPPGLIHRLYDKEHYHVVSYAGGGESG